MNTTVRRMALAFLWVASLLGVGLWAEQRGAQADPPMVQPGQPVGDVITGSDIGFQRVAGSDPEGRTIGYVVVRVNGQWRPTAGVTRLVK